MPEDFIDSASESRPIAEVKLSLRFVGNTIIARWPIMSEIDQSSCLNIETSFTIGDPCFLASKELYQSEIDPSNKVDH